MVKKTAKKATRKTSRKFGRKPVGKKRTAKPEDLCIQLPGEPGIRDAAELHQQLLAAVDHAAGVTIDASAITRVDSAILQLLTVFVIERKSQGQPVVWKQPSEVFCRAARMIDLADPLGLQPAPAQS